MKKLFAILTAIALTVCLAGCGAQIDVKVDDPEGLASTIISNLPESSEITSSESPTDSEVTSEPTPNEEASTPSLSTPSTPSTTSTPSTPSSPSSTIKPSTTPSTPAKNEFINHSNNFVSPGDLAIRPKYVYWDGNTLVAECYIVNGLSRPVYNINVCNITLNNRSQQIAAAVFGVCNGLTVQPNQSVVWTFRFGADCIQSMGADITYLECGAEANYNY